MIKYRKQWAQFSKEQSFIVDAEKREQDIFSPPPKYEIAINMPKPNDPSQSNTVDGKDNEKSTNSELFRNKNFAHDPTARACHVYRRNSDHSFHLPTYDEFMEFSRQRNICNL